MQSYRVKREHIGDKDYSVGDVRNANAQDVAHLVDSGVLEPVGPKGDGKKPAQAKSAPAAKNKRAAVPANKSA